MRPRPTHPQCRQALAAGEASRARQARSLGRSLPPRRDPAVTRLEIRTTVVRRAVGVIDRDAEVVALITERLAANRRGEGRPSELSVRTALVCFVLLALLESNFHLINLPVLVGALSWRTRRQLGIDYLDRHGHPKQVSYQQLLRAFHAIAAAFDPLAGGLSAEESDERAAALQELSFRLVQASIATANRPGDYAVDAALKWGWDRPSGVNQKIERRGRDGEAGRGPSRCRR